ncbi:MAG: hypothetical protein WD468_00555 [Pirellulales bacterium]
MTAQVEEFLKSFEGLSDLDKQEAAVALLGRVLQYLPPDVPEDSLVALADELFLELDAREAAADGQP